MITNIEKLRQALSAYPEILREFKRVEHYQSYAHEPYNGHPMQSLINGCFVWCSTPQGSDYWYEDVYTQGLTLLPKGVWVDAFGVTHKKEAAHDTTTTRG